MANLRERAFRERQFFWSHAGLRLIQQGFRAGRDLDRIFGKSSGSESGPLYGQRVDLLRSDVAREHG